MNITTEGAHALQNLRAASCMTSNDHSGLWAQVMLFDDGSTILVRGETRRPGSPGEVLEVLFGTEGNALEPIEVSTYESLVERYSPELT